LIAELRLLAKVARVALVIKVAAEPEPVQVYEPLPPAVTPLHEKIPLTFASVAEKVVELPGVVSVIVNELPLVQLEVAPTAG
jgi:hypothetical protein